MSERHMRIAAVQIENLRAIKDQIVKFDDYTALIGPNGAGKSTVLFALNIFFQEAQAGATSAKALSKEDFHRQDTSIPIRITVTFEGLNDAATEEFGHYCRHGKLIVTAEAKFDPDTGVTVTRQYGSRMGIEAFKPFFESKKAGEPVSNRKVIFKELLKQFPSLRNASTDAAMETALRSYEDERPAECKPIESSDQFYGATKGANLLAKYIQWVYVPAVKEVAQEQQEGKDTALGKLLARTVRASVDFNEGIKAIEEEARAKYGDLLIGKQESLKALEDRLSESVQRVAHPHAAVKLAWNQDANKAVAVAEPFAIARTQEFGMDPHLIARSGHGLQRAYLLALLQVLATVEADEAPTLILAVEEAELFQHPPQARHLASVLQELAAGNCQVMVTTHSPYFVSAQRLESIRLVRRVRPTGQAMVSQCSWEQIRNSMREALGEDVPDSVMQVAKLAPELMKGLDEMFFAQLLVLVESHEDSSYLEAHAALTNHSDALRSLGVVVVPCHGKNNILRPLAIAVALSIPVVCMFDADGDKSGAERTKHEKQNVALQRLSGATSNSAFPSELLLEARCISWPTCIGDAVGDSWPAGTRESAWAASGKTYREGDNWKKNPMAVAHFLSHARDAGHLCSHLERVVDAILSIANSNGKQFHDTGSVGL